MLESDVCAPDISRSAVLVLAWELVSPLDEVLVSELASRLDVELALLCGAAYESALAATADSVRRMSAQSIPRTDRLDSIPADWMSVLQLRRQVAAAAAHPAPERLGSAFQPKSNRGWAAEGNF